MLLTLKCGRAAGAALFLVFALTAALWPAPAGAQQIKRPVILAPGYSFTEFAGIDNVVEFNNGQAAGPTALAFDARGRLFVGMFSEKILIMLDNNEDGRVDQVKTFASNIPRPLGMAFRDNGDLFISSNIFGGAGRILRLRDTDGDDVADEITTVVDNLPSSGQHQTSRLRFGPDGLLYFSQGSSTDNGTGTPAEGPLNATILRIDVDGANPTPTVFARGLRNAFGIAFHPENGALFATDAGSGEFDGPGSGAPPDEVNWVVEGGHYGFPNCEGTPSPDRPGCAGVRGPSLQYPPHLTPTGLTFYTGPQAGDFEHQLLVTLYKNYPTTNGEGGDLRRIVVTGDPQAGFQLADAGFIAQFDPVDPFDGPLDVAIDPITGDIYVARFDPVNHPAPFKQNHTIYRILRTGADQQPFIGAIEPASVVAGSGAATIRFVARRMKPGAVVLANGQQVGSRPGDLPFEVVADLPAALTATARTIQIEVQNADGKRSNALPFVVRNPNDPGPGPGSPALAAAEVIKKKNSKVVNPVFAGSKGKKLRLRVTGNDFSAGAQLLVNGAPLTLVSASATQLVGQLTNQLLAAPGELNVQVRNADGRTSNTLNVVVTGR